MKLLHTPRIDARYWTAILLASLFGTNMGDLYAHEAHLGIWVGTALLAVLAALVFAAERFNDTRTEAFYWTVIIIIRTGATNIADYLAFRVRIPPNHHRIPPLALSLGLIALLCVFAYFTRTRADGGAAMPSTGTAYWLAMLTAGVYGTAEGDIVSHLVGQGVASLILGALFSLVLLVGRGRAARIVALYWLTVAIARTAGTAMGDWLAENPTLHIGLPISTLITGVCFIAVLVFWKSRAKWTDAVGVSRRPL